jgi:hypothetical protein
MIRAAAWAVIITASEKARERMASVAGPRFAKRSFAALIVPLHQGVWWGSCDQTAQ